MSGCPLVSSHVAIRSGSHGASWLSREPLADFLLTFAVVRHVWAARLGGFSLEQKIGIALTASFAVQSLFQYFLYFEFVWFSIAVLVAASTVKLAASSSEMEESYA